MFIGLIFLKYKVGIIADIIVTIITIMISIDKSTGLKDKTVIDVNAGFFTNVTKASTINPFAYSVSKNKDNAEKEHIRIPTKTI